MVPGDWGGPIGPSWAVAHPERVCGLFILNTYAHGPRGKLKLPLPLRLVRTPGVGEVLVKSPHLVVRVFVFRVGVVHCERLTREVRRAYLAPHPSWSSRTGVLVFPCEIPANAKGPVAELTARLERGLAEHFRLKPVRIMWGMRDPAFTPQTLDNLWLRTPDRGGHPPGGRRPLPPGGRARADRARAALPGATRRPQRARPVNA